MVDKEEYSCLKFLSMLLAEEKAEFDVEKGTNIAHLFYQEVVNSLIESNHEEFVAFMQWKCNMFGVNLSRNFSEGSLAYVEKFLSDATENLISSTK